MEKPSLVLDERKKEEALLEFNFWKKKEINIQLVREGENAMSGA